MAAPRKYPDELRDRATRLAVEARKDPVGRWVYGDAATPAPTWPDWSTTPIAAYRAVRYTERLDEAAAVASVGSKGDSYD